ncbi:MAG: hypothetical protein LC723_00255 [Actinobacteria bacterium]|nr:hypothetical protein [Actinomycetota bacterium]
MQGTVEVVPDAASVVTAVDPDEGTAAAEAVERDEDVADPEVAEPAVAAADEGHGSDSRTDPASTVTEDEETTA